MVSTCCKLAVETELKKIGLHNYLIGLGKVSLQNDISPYQLLQLQSGLSKQGLELLCAPDKALVEEIKNTIIKMVRYDDEQPKIKYSVFLSETLHHDYTYLSNVFSNQTGNTIEHYIIAHKIERTKELLFFNQLNLTEISYLLNYSSVAHLSNQFKKVTGLTPSAFKHQENAQLKTFDNV